MLWLFFAISAYFSMAIASVGDRFLLIGPLPNPRVYAFLVNLFAAVFIIFLLPFGSFGIPEINVIVWALVGGFFWVMGLVTYFDAIQKSEVSRVVPAVGGLVPIFTMLGAWILGKGVMSAQEFLAFSFLIFGSALITAKKIKSGSFFSKGFEKIVLAALLLSCRFLSAKIVFVEEKFVSGMFWLLLGGLVAAFSLLWFSDVREHLFVHRSAFQRKVWAPFLFFQTFGATGFFLQSFSIALADFRQLPIINALEGTRYLFLFIFVGLISLWRPELLKEEMRGTILWQKLVAAGLIVWGITLLAFL